MFVDDGPGTQSQCLQNGGAIALPPLPLWYRLPRCRRSAHAMRGFRLCAPAPAGGKDQKAQPPYGADVLRLWVASVDYATDVQVGMQLLDAVLPALMSDVPTAPGLRGVFLWPASSERRRAAGGR